MMEQELQDDDDASEEVNALLSLFPLMDYERAYAECAQSLLMP